MGGRYIKTFLLAVLVWASLSYSAGRCDYDFKLASVLGWEFRKIDVKVFIKVSEGIANAMGDQILHKVEGDLHIDYSVKHTGQDNTYEVEVVVKNVGKGDVGPLVLKHKIPIKNFLWTVKAAKVFSLYPRIDEKLTINPTDAGRDYVVFVLPPLKSGEMVELRYLLNKKPQSPPFLTDLKGEKTLKTLKDSVPKPKPVKKETLVYQASFFYPKRHYETMTPESQINFQALRDLIAKFREEGIDYRIKVTGWADRKGNRKFNEEVATKRARIACEKLTDLSLPLLPPPPPPKEKKKPSPTKEVKEPKSAEHKEEPAKTPPETENKDQKDAPAEREGTKEAKSTAGTDAQPTPQEDFKPDDLKILIEPKNESSLEPTDVIGK